VHFHRRPESGSPFADRELLASAIRDLTDAIAAAELVPADVRLAQELLDLLSAAAARHDSPRQAAENRQLVGL
jgi:hypothetical protein